MCDPSTDDILKDQVSYNNWKTNQSTNINLLQANISPSNDDYIALTTIAMGINKVSNCLNKKLEMVNSVQTDLATTQSTISNFDKTIEERKNDVEVAKERAALTKNPEKMRSYYEGWFPIDRPLKHYTIPVLIGISLFMITLTFFYFMSLVGIDTRLSLQVPQGVYQRFGRSGSSYKSTLPNTQFTKSFWGMTAVAIILGGLTIYGFRK
jgi:hypothetical protein